MAHTTDDAEGIKPTEKKARGGMKKRYADLREKAKAAYHDVHVVIRPGGLLANGETVTIKLFDCDPNDLDAVFGVIEKYLDTDAAKARGNLYRRRDDAEIEQLLAGARLRAAELQIQLDLEEAIKQGESSPLQLEA